MDQFIDVEFIALLSSLLDKKKGFRGHGKILQSDIIVFPNSYLLNLLLSDSYRIWFRNTLSDNS